MLIISRRRRRASSLQQTEDRNAVRCSQEHLAVRDRRRDVLVTGAELIAAAGLAAVVEFVCEIGGVVSVQHTGVGIFVRPDDAVRCAVG